ncbi:glycosyltransferase family 2 protein [Leptospira brenneri]|uniref:glycosyltransferase family 2 protein n=1 Tax=Leptospira brenneri TaxID=2023182 RepID=UPI000C2A9512|nr:glycosyltransferase [Leptospira brenneri]PJZ45506.1 hypothetical protein CH361_10800 [Leptospira brenneri]
MPFFSVVIPTYNRAEKLKLTIESVLRQTYGNFELLIMDDGSTDHTESVVNDFKDTRIHYHWAPNSGGPATPRNRGILKAAAPWITFLDADDLWYPNRLFEIEKSITKNSEIDVFSHNEMLTTPDNQEKRLLQYGPYESDFYRVLLTKGNRLSTSATTIRTSFLIQNELRFNESPDYVIIEDYDLWLRMAFLNAKFLFIQEALGEYIIEDDNISNSIEKIDKNQRNMMREHVYNIQQFDSDRDKLWQDVCLRLDFEKFRSYLRSGKTFQGIQLMLRSLFFNPISFTRIIAVKLTVKLSGVP